MYHFLAAGLLAASALVNFTGAVAIGGRASNTAPEAKLAVYYGQGANQDLMGKYCNDDTIDIIPIGFVNVFPKNSGSVDGYPGLNFGNQCGGGWKDADGHDTGMFANCWQMIPEIQKCQANGKKVLLSLGGDSTVWLENDQAGSDFADFLWGAFGPYKSGWTGPRPFGNDVAIDGFDFDIETQASNLPSGQGIQVDTGLTAAANRFRNIWASEGTPRLLTAAPQCVVPDERFQHVLAQASFDAVFIQFYNTAYCSARAYFDKSFGQDISYDSWISWLSSNSANRAIKAYIGLPAAPGDNSATQPYYLSGDEAKTLADHFGNKYPSTFGGVMLWEMTSSANNVDAAGRSYAQVIRNDFDQLWPKVASWSSQTVAVSSPPRPVSSFHSHVPTTRGPSGFVTSHRTIPFTSARPTMTSWTAS